MKFSNKINIFIIVFLIMPTFSFTLTQSPLSSIGTIQSNQQVNYEFIWTEFKDSPGYIDGDDSVVFGPDLGPYHNYSELEFKLKSLESSFPEIIGLTSIGKSYFGRDIFVVKLTDESVSSDEKLEILLVAQHHAREQITRENALYFLDKMVSEYQNGTQEIVDLLKTREIYVIPSLNVDGAELLSEFPWARKTARPVDEDGDGSTDDENEISDIDENGYIEIMYANNGTDWNFWGYEGTDLDSDGTTGEDPPGGVDPNRNYDFQFGNQSGASSIPISEAYHGDKPFSENITARFRDFVLTRDFATAISLHSGIELIIGPWGWSNQPPEGEIGEFYNKTGTEFEAITGIEFNFLYYVSGEWGDWMFSQDNTLIEFTIEVYGDPDKLVGEFRPMTGLYHEWGIWDFFNPPANEVIENSEKIYSGLVYLFANAQFQSNSPGFTNYSWLGFMLGVLLVIPKIMIKKDKYE